MSCYQIPGYVIDKSLSNDEYDFGKIIAGNKLRPAVAAARGVEIARETVITAEGDLGGDRPGGLPLRVASYDVEHGPSNGGRC